jgi:protein phosphatase
MGALEVMSRFAVDPRWLIYLPPTMSPVESSPEGAYLEHPREVFAHYRREGVPRVMCEEKHMGSRAVVVLCRDEAAATRRFGSRDGRLGVIYTRTGRPFFSEAGLEAQVLGRLRSAFSGAGLWERLETDWACLDTELMPWSAKAQELLRGQYAAVGASSRVALAAAVDALERTTARSEGTRALLERMRTRRSAVEDYVGAYRRYCWPVDSLDDLKIAPFHLLATEGRVHVDKDHAWHMDTLAALCAQDPRLLRATECRVVSVTDPESEAAGTAWWEAKTERGGEGMVVKPMDWVVRGRRGPAQPAIKCRGREYLRIIYGPEYTVPEHLERLRARSLGRKRSLASREFTLGLEALHRFVEEEPLYRVHQCVFGVLALETEPVDPRL